MKDVTANAPWRNPPVIDVDDSDDEQSGGQVIAADDSGQCHLSGSEDSDHWALGQKEQEKSYHLFQHHVIE